MLSHLGPLGLCMDDHMANSSEGSAAGFVIPPGVNVRPTVLAGQAPKAECHETVVCRVLD